MKRKRRLSFGQTPLSRMTKRELLVTSERMYCALGDCYSALRLSSREDHPFWSNVGTGGRAIAAAEQALSKINDKYDGENVYRSYFRSARDLLFDCSKTRIGFGWIVCDECETWHGNDLGQVRSQCPFCKSTRLRKLKWEDVGRAEDGALVKKKKANELPAKETGEV